MLRFYKRPHTPSSFQKELGALHSKVLSKHLHYTTFPLFLAANEACNISSKYWLPNKSAK